LVLLSVGLMEDHGMDDGLGQKAFDMVHVPNVTTNSSSMD
jgi:hypothetical protein